jgi:hypothetical protein
MSFATKYLDALAGGISAPWRAAFSQCEFARKLEDTYNTMRPPLIMVPGFPVPTGKSETNAITLCAIAMANAHINTDIVNSLRSVGCIDQHDYGNVLLFVERGAHVAIMRLQGALLGEIYDQLKQLLLPLDRIWRNAVYVQECKASVPDVEDSFRAGVDRTLVSMRHVYPSAH